MGTREHFTAALNRRDDGRMGAMLFMLAESNQAMGKAIEHLVATDAPELATSSALADVVELFVQHTQELTDLIDFTNAIPAPSSRRRVIRLVNVFLAGIGLGILVMMAATVIGLSIR